MARRIQRHAVRGKKQKSAATHEGDPRSWPFLLQDLEASKAIKKLIGGPREIISEAFVRDSISRHLDIRPEDVTLKQIRHAVADLLPYYPAITVIPQGPVTETDRGTGAAGSKSKPIRDRRAERWEDIEIRFLSDERIQVGTPGMTRTLNYAEFGFEDRRNERPNRAWITLRAFAENNGILKQPTNEGQSWRGIEKRAQEIRRVFREYFSIQEDPLPFVGGTGYQAQFRIGCSQSYDT